MNIYTPPHLRRVNGIGNSGVGERGRVNGMENSGSNEEAERRCLTSSENLERKCKTENVTSTINRARRPDLKVYVPRALRTSLPVAASQTDSQNSTKSSNSAETSPRNTQATSQVRSNHARNAIPSQCALPTLSKDSHSQYRDQSSEKDCQKLENNEGHIPTPADVMHTITNISSISHTVTHSSKHESNSSESKRPIENSINTSVDLVTELGQVLVAEQNETLKILNVPLESTRQTTVNTDNLKDKFKSSENGALEICTSSESNTPRTNKTADDADMEVDQGKQLSETTPVDMDTSDMIEQYNTSKDEVSDGDNNVNSSKDNGLRLQEDIDVPNSVINTEHFVSFNESLSCESYVNGDEKSNKMESNVPELPESTDVLAYNEYTKINENEACALNTSDIDNEVPNKVRVVETFSNDSDSIVITKLVSESTPIEIVPTVPVTDTIYNGNESEDTLLPIIAGCQKSNLQSNTDSNDSTSCVEFMLSKESPSLADPQCKCPLANETSKTTDSIELTSGPSCETLHSSPAKNIASECSSLKINSESCPSNTIKLSEVTESTLEGVPSNPLTSATPVSSSTVSTDSKSSPVNLSLDDCDWDTLYDDDGDCLVPDIINEVMDKMGEVSVHTPTEEYRTFQSAEERTCDGENILEIYGFSSSCTNRDLMDIFAAYQRTYFHLKWVDDTHALGVFSSPLVADEVLNTNLPNVKTRPLKEASPLSKAKAKSLNLIATPLPRPKTCLSSARRLVSGALGIRVQVSETKREEERQILRDAREKKRQEAKQRQDIWEKD